MKTLIIITILVVLFLVGCSEQGFNQALQNLNQYYQQQQTYQQQRQILQTAQPAYVVPRINVKIIE